MPRGEACLRKWNAIPDETDILVTHTPPIGHGDLCCTGVRAGCVELLSTVPVSYTHLDVYKRQPLQKGAGV